jgi:hypothetical protein
MPTQRELEEMKQDFIRMDQERNRLPTSEDDAKLMLFNAMNYLGIKPTQLIIKTKETHA